MHKSESMTHMHTQLLLHMINGSRCTCICTYTHTHCQIMPTGVQPACLYSLHPSCLLPLDLSVNWNIDHIDYVTRIGNSSHEQNVCAGNPCLIITAVQFNGHKYR